MEAVLSDDRQIQQNMGYSLAFHLLILLLGWFLLSHTPATPTRRTSIVEMLPAPKHIAKSSTKDRIVQTAPAQNSETAAPNSYLGEKTQRVDRETVAKATNLAVSGGSNAPTKKEQARTQKNSKTPAPLLSQLGVPILPKIPKPGEQAQKPTDDRRWGEYAKTPEEYLKGVQEAERTVLNTKEFVYYGYYQRIRERLDRAWIPMLRAQVAELYRRGRQLASDNDYTTRVLVVLNKNGEIVRIQMMSESGTKDLDEAAVSAFNKAGPFPNPPKGLVDGNDQVEIPWEFILKT